MRWIVKHIPVFEHPEHADNPLRRGRYLGLSHKLIDKKNYKMSSNGIIFRKGVVVK